MDLSNQWPPITTIKEIMKDLPDHFTKEALDQVEKDYDKEILCIYEEAVLIGFIIFQIKKTESEILWMAIDRYHQGKRFGSFILNSFERYLIVRGINSIIVKTLDDSANYEPYHRTTKFYRKNGFIKIRFLEEIPEWGPGNPCAIYEKRIN